VDPRARRPACRRRSPRGRDVPSGRGDSCDDKWKPAAPAVPSACLIDVREVVGRRRQRSRRMNRIAYAALAAASFLAAAPAFAVAVETDQQAAAPDVAGRAGASAVADVIVTA